MLIQDDALVACVSGDSLPHSFAVVEGLEARCEGWLSSRAGETSNSQVAKHSKFCVVERWFEELG